MIIIIIIFNGNIIYNCYYMFYKLQINGYFWYYVIYLIEHIFINEKKLHCLTNILTDRSVNFIHLENRTIYQHTFIFCL